jgi:hypothetical protein
VHLGLTERSILGLGGDFNFLSAQESGHQLGDDQFDYDGVSIDYSIEDYVAFRRRRRRRIRRTNRHFRIESIKKSSGITTREMTQELSSSDRYGNFRHYFRMPLFKVEELTTLLIRRGYIDQPRSYFRQREYRERADILVMSVLHTLGNGASFRSLRAQTNISISKCRKLFLRFIDAMVDMKDDFIYMPRNVGEMNRLERDYREVGLRADLLMRFTSSGVAVPQEISIAPRGRRGIQLLLISVLPILIGELLAYTAQHLDHSMTRTLSRLIQT